VAAALEQRAAEGALAGDPGCVAVMDRARRALAAACVGYVNTFNPHRIVIGGSIAEAEGERLLGEIRAAIRDEAFEAVAQREFAEETGFAVASVAADPAQPPVDLGEVQLKSGKIVRAWAVEGDLDLQGTLGMRKDVPVGFENIRIRFEVRSAAATAEQRRALQEKTEQYCVVMQTLLHPPKIESVWA